MRDYYSIINAGPTYTKSMLKERISTLPAGKLKEDISFILLDEGRKKIYDRAWRTLKILGYARKHMLLDKKNGWTQRNSDFCNLKQKDLLALGLDLDHEIEIYCPEQKNNKDYASQQKKSCKNNIGQEAQQSNVKYAPRQGGIFIFFIMFALLVLFTLLYKSDFKISLGSDVPSKSDLQQEKRNADINRAQQTKNKTYTNLTPKARPYTKVEYSVLGGVAPLKIITPHGSDYLVRLVSVIYNEQVFEAYIRGGDTITAYVPIGNYELKYASGSIWYGYDTLFGPNTVYMKADKIFSFKADGDSYSGYKITLIKQLNGNLSTNRINAKDF